MIKPTLAATGLISLFAGSFYGSTELGLRSTGWREIEVKVASRPSYSEVGKNLFTNDGTKLLVTSIKRGKGAQHMIRAKVQVTERKALSLFPLRWSRSFSMDQAAAERTVLEAAGISPGAFVPSTPKWHAVQ